MKFFKKTLVFLLCLALIAAIPVAAGAQKLGDVDGNGQLEAADARLALRIAVGLEKIFVGSKAYTAADADGNGKVDAADARLILRACVGLENLGSPVKKPTDTGDPQPGDATDDPSSDPGTSEPQNVNYTVTPAEWANVAWESYENVYFTLRIPKGWQVEWQGNAQQLYWRATNPEGTIGLSNLDHRYAAKDIRYMQMGAVDMYLANGTVQEFFETAFANSTEYFTVKNSTVPDNKAQLQAIRPSTLIRDYQSMYAVFKENDLEGEGVYSAVIMDSPDVWVGGMNYGLWEINCIFTEWTPLGELVNWQPVLSTIAQSFQYTDYYIQEWRSVLNTSASPEGQTNIGDDVLEAFEERSTADTILQEKRSDMIGEYERVVDNETGDIYRAYDGFLDDIGTDQTRYSPITESQYADGFVGWIDKS